MLNLKTWANQTYQCWTSGKLSLPDGQIFDISSEIEKSKKMTLLFNHKEICKLLKNLPCPLYTDCSEILFKHQTTLEAIEELYDQDPDIPIGALNFASAKKPGGGWLNGAQAQEESLARSSTLVASLSSKVCDEFYDPKLNASLLSSGVYSDSVIASPNCLIIRDSQGAFCLPKKCEFLTCAAVNANKARKTLREFEIETLMKFRVEAVLAVAVARKLPILVLGAWGF